MSTRLLLTRDSDFLRKPVHGEAIIVMNVNLNVKDVDLMIKFSFNGKLYSFSGAVMRQSLTYLMKKATCTYIVFCKNVF